LTLIWRSVPGCGIRTWRCACRAWLALSLHLLSQAEWIHWEIRRLESTRTSWEERQLAEAQQDRPEFRPSNFQNLEFLCPFNGGRQSMTIHARSEPCTSTDLDSTQGGVKPCETPHFDWTMDMTLHTGLTFC
jgi:hypothetical protein